MAPTVAEFVSLLRQHNPSKPVCFCRSPEGLQFYRFKRRGPQLLQLEFNENVYRDGNGRLIVQAVDAAPSNPKELARTVGSLINSLDDPDSQNFALVFGGDHEALKFGGIEDFGDWASVEFEQRVFRIGNRAFMVEETREGNPIREEFPLLETRDASEATTGAFAALAEYNEPEIAVGIFRPSGERGVPRDNSERLPRLGPSRHGPEAKLCREAACKRGSHQNG